MVQYIERLGPQNQVQTLGSQRERPFEERRQIVNRIAAAGIAALTIYDMCKSIDRSMTIGDLALWEKTGGRSGTWRRQSDGSDPFGF